MDRRTLLVSGAVGSAGMFGSGYLGYRFANRSDDSESGREDDYPNDRDRHNQLEHEEATIEVDGWENWRFGYPGGGVELEFEVVVEDGPAVDVSAYDPEEYKKFTGEEEGDPWPEFRETDVHRIKTTIPYRQVANAGIAVNIVVESDRENPEPSIVRFEGETYQ